MNCTVLHGDIQKYTHTVQKLLVGKILLTFLKVFSLLRLHLFDQKYSKIRNIVKYYYNLKYLFSM